MDNRLHLPGNRGPYLNSRTAYADIQLQLEWITEGTIKEDDDSASNFGEDDQMMKRQCHEYLSKLSTVFGYEDQKWYSVTLHHSNQNVANWGIINVVPEWEATEHPRFCNLGSPKTNRSPQSHPTKTSATSLFTPETAA